MKVRTKTMIAFMLPDDNDFHMDEDGNSLREKTIEELIKQRNIIKDGGAS